MSFLLHAECIPNNIFLVDMGNEGSSLNFANSD